MVQHSGSGPAAGTSGFLAAHVAAELAVKLETAGTVEP
jgi:hypothetical protein